MIGTQGAPRSVPGTSWSRRSPWSFHNEHYRKLYGKMEKDQLRRLKTLEVENRRLKKIVADQALDLQIVKEALEGKY